jgi:pimeloyl-ACP methyl ester carboxylesterase
MAPQPSFLALRIRSNALAVVVAVLCSLVARGVLAEDETDKPLPPADTVLRTRDGVALHATFYPSKLGKEAVPVVLLHGENGSRGDYKAFALELQALGHAVIAPDLRGHGDSALSRGPDRALVLKPDDLASMVSQDMEAVKSFLVSRNNAGELNIEKLCLVGAEMGSVVAVNFAARDWSWPVLATGKQGQDVKSLVLISPEWTHRGLNINEAIEHPQVRSLLSVIIFAGERSAKERRDAERLHKMLERFRPAPSPNDVAGTQSLWLRTPPTSLQGTQLLNESRLGVRQMIERFIELRLVDVRIPWRERKSPLD